MEFRRVLFRSEAVGWGMRAAVYLGELTGTVEAADAAAMLELVRRYGPIPPVNRISAANLQARLVHDKKTVQGAIHFLLPVRVGEVKVVSGVDEKLVLTAIERALA